MLKSLLITTLLTWTTLLLSAQHNSYYIGHSGFGWELIVGEMVNDLAADAGISTYDYDYQFIGGTCLSGQWVNHATPTVGTDSHIELSTGNYDYLLLLDQIPLSEVIYTSPWGCDLTAVQATDSFAGLALAANPNTKVYLVEYHNEINQYTLDPYVQWTGTNAAERVLNEQVMDSVSLLNGGLQVCRVPISAAYQAMVDSVRAGVFPGITDWLDLFDPMDPDEATVHPTEETFYLAACVHFATLFGQSPVGLTNQTFAVAGWQFDPPTPAQAAMMQEIAWEVVSNDPRACVSGMTVRENEAALAEEKLFEIRQTEDYVEIRILEEDFNRLELHDMQGRLMYALTLSTSVVRIPHDRMGKGIFVFRLMGGKNFISGKILR